MQTNFQFILVVAVVLPCKYHEDAFTITLGTGTTQKATRSDKLILKEYVISDTVWLAL